jgi:hypothetical protein
MSTNTGNCFGKLCNNINTTNDLSGDDTLKNTQLNQLKIMGSYASYSSSGSYYAVKTSLNQLQKNILLQNRFIHLDVYFKVKDNEKVPIVKSEKNTDYLLFDDCCETIQRHAWSSKILSHYPLFLFIYLRYDSINIDVSNKVGDILIKHFSDNWPDIKYQNGFQSGNLATETLGNFMNKVIILTNYTDDDTLSNTENNTPRDNGLSLNEKTHSYIKIYKNITNMINDNKVNFGAFNYNNVSNDELSMNQYGDFSKNKEQLKEKFLIIFSDYNNSQYITKTYTFNIRNAYTSLVNVVAMIYYDVDDKSKLFDLLVNYIIFFTIKGVYMPIRHLHAI